MEHSRKRQSTSLRVESLSIQKRLKTSLDVREAHEVHLRDGRHSPAEPNTMVDEMSVHSPHDTHAQRSFFQAFEVSSRNNGRDPLDALPDAIVFQILLKVPPRDVAKCCSLTSTAWAKLARSEELWEAFCTPWGLSHLDASGVLGGWRGLYAQIFGANLVQCPNFERIHHSDSSGDKDSLYDSGPFKPTAKLLVERIMSLGEIDPEYSARSHWGADGEGMQGIFMRGGINSLYRTHVTGLYQEPTPSLEHHLATCSCNEVPQELAGSLHAGPAEEAVNIQLVDSEDLHTSGVRLELPVPGSDAVCTAKCTWGCLKQSISLKSYSTEFLDQCAPIHLSAWCASKNDSQEDNGFFRMQLVMIGGDKSPIYHWDSQEIRSKNNKWRNLSIVVKNYPKGVRGLVLKIAGKGVHFTQVHAGFVPSC